MFHPFFIKHSIALLIIIFNSVQASDTTGEALLKNAIKDFPANSKSAGSLDYKNSCANCSSVNSKVIRKTTILNSPENNQKIKLSVISETELSTLFANLAARKDIPFGYPDGCFARAHKMVHILEDQGIIAGKAFLEGMLFVDTEFGQVGWGYHVAPVVMVKKGSKILPYVLDPSLFNTAVPQSEWKALMLENPKSIFKKDYYTNRFAYDPRDRTADYHEDVDEFMEDMNATNNNYTKKLQEMRENGE